MGTHMLSGNITKSVLVPGADPVSDPWPKGTTIKCRWKAETVIALSTLRGKPDLTHSSPCQRCASDCKLEREPQHKPSAQLPVSLETWQNHSHGRECDSLTCPKFQFHKNFDSAVHTKERLAVSNDAITGIATVAPFEIKLGLKFKFKAFEQCVSSMAEGERSRFVIVPPATLDYAQLAIVLQREAGENFGTCCAGHNPLSCVFQPEASPREKLQAFAAAPMQLRPLLFSENAHILLLEIFVEKVEPFGSRLPEVWELSADEKLNLARSLHKQARDMLVLNRANEETISLLERSVDYTTNLYVTGQCADTQDDCEQLTEMLTTSRLNLALAQVNCGQYMNAVRNLSWLIERKLLGKGDSLAYKLYYRRGVAQLKLARDFEAASDDLQKCQRYVAAMVSDSTKSALEQRVKESLLQLEQECRKSLATEKQMYRRLFKN